MGSLVALFAKKQVLLAVLCQAEVSDFLVVMLGAVVYGDHIKILLKSNPKI